MPAQINQLPKPLFSSEDASPALQAFLSQITDTVNSLAGYSGSIPLADHLDMGGKRIMNVGTPEEATDALSSGVAEGSYSASVLGPQLETRSKTGLKSMRRLNDTNQREQSSSYLNDLMSSVPSANAIYPLISNVGGMVQVVIPASLFTFADGTTLLLISRTDLLSLPAQYAINSIACIGNTVTVQTFAATGLSAGEAATIVGVTPASFDGTYELTSVSGVNLTYQLSLGTVAGSGGLVQVNSVYYYYVNKRDPTVHLAGPFTADTMQNRIQTCFDGAQIVAVVVITNSGGQVSLSGGGGSPILGSPTAGSFF